MQGVDEVSRGSIKEERGDEQKKKEKKQKSG